MEDLGADLGKKVVFKNYSSACGKPPQNRPHRPSHVLACGLCTLDGGVQAAIVACGTAIEMVLEGDERRGLAGLPRRAQDEVILGVD